MSFRGCQTEQLLMLIFSVHSSDAHPPERKVNMCIGEPYRGVDMPASRRKEQIP